jgi:hypothetical protein
MRQYHMYLRNGKVFIPTFGLVHKGLYRDVEPVAVVDVSDTGALRQAFRETMPEAIRPRPTIRATLIRCRSWSNMPA